MEYYELNLDGLVGPTHHYAGLAPGNMASTNNALKPANPQAAALQGIEKMRYLLGLGLKQGVLPPHARPNIDLLKQLGFSGDTSQIIGAAAKQAPNLLSAAYSASPMWTANAATITPSLDSVSGKVNMTAANLISNIHRHQEASFSSTLLQAIFADEHYFSHHAPLPACSFSADEGAANHNRLSQHHGVTGHHLYIHGCQAQNNQAPRPKKFPARQTLESHQALARSHQTKAAYFASQNPDVIDQGVFHHDVIGVANEHVVLIHEDALIDQGPVFAHIQSKADFDLNIITIPNSAMTVADAVNTYLFNSQLLTLPGNQGMLLLAPIECQEHARVKQVIDGILSQNDNPINQVKYMDLRQSMRNGGGPACLRLRVPLSEAELSAMHQGVLLNHTKLDRLEHWIKSHYRTELHANDLADVHLIDEVYTALDALTVILELGSIYPFQK